jgi:hypothetical protein
VQNNTFLFVLFLKLRASIAITHHQEFSADPQNQGK